MPNKRTARTTRAVARQGRSIAKQGQRAGKGRGGGSINPVSGKITQNTRERIPLPEGFKRYKVPKTPWPKDSAW